MRARERKIGLQIVHYRTGQPLGEIVAVIGKVSMHARLPGRPATLVTIYEARPALMPARAVDASPGGPS